MGCILMHLNLSAPGRVGGKEKGDRNKTLSHRQHCVQASCSFPGVSHPHHRGGPHPELQSLVLLPLWAAHGGDVPWARTHPESTVRCPQLCPYSTGPQSPASGCTFSRIPLPRFTRRALRRATVRHLRSPRVQPSDVGSLWPTSCCSSMGTCQPDDPANVHIYGDCF